MSPLVGVVYKWKHGLLNSYWKRYFLSLDESTGKLLYLKRNGEVKGRANLAKIFLAIHLRPFQSNDRRMNGGKSRRFAPYALVIPMLEFNTKKVENQEFALGGLDQLETWLRTFAECMGVGGRFRRIEDRERMERDMRKYELDRGGGTKAELKKWLKNGAMVKSSNGGKYRSQNHYGYEHDYYPCLWMAFLDYERTCHYAEYPHFHSDCVTDGSAFNAVTDSSQCSEPSFSFHGSCIVDPTGMVTDSSCVSSTDWSSFMGDSSGGGSSGGGDSSGGGGWDFGGCDSSGGGWSGGDFSGGGGCDSGGGGGGGCDSGGGGGGGGCDSGGGGC